MRKTKGKDEDNFKNPKIDMVILQWANTALGNRLDNYKRQLEAVKQTERTCLAVSESYDYFFASFFSGWKNFLTKLERINLLVKKQDNTERYTSKFKLVFDSIMEMAQVITKLKEAADKAAKDMYSQQNQQSQNYCSNVEKNGVNAAGSGNDVVAYANQNASANLNGLTAANSVSSMKKTQTSVNLIELQKLTRNRVEGFLKLFENIYTEVTIDCATYGQRMSECVKTIASANDSNETMRRLYKENSQLQEKLKQFESFIEKQVPLNDSEKDFISGHFNAQSKVIEELQRQLNEQRELVEHLSLRVRHKMDYSLTSIQAKVGQSSENKSKSIENNVDPPVNNESQDSKREIEIEREGFECVCGGYQAEYFSQKLEEAAKKISDTKLEILQLSTQQSGTALGNLPGLISKISGITKEVDSSGIKGGNGKTSGVFELKNPEENESGILEILASSAIQGVSVLSAPLGAPVIVPEDEIYDKKLKITLGEKIAILTKQRDQVTEECAQQERVIREMEIERNNIEESFFSSGVYAALTAQTEELLKTVQGLKQQLFSAKNALIDLEKLRFKEMSETVTKFKEEKETLQSQLKDAREGVYKESLGQLMRENMASYFNYKKYTEPLQEQLNRMGESLQQQRELCKSLEAQKIEFQKSEQALTKQISDQLTLLHEREIKILQLQANQQLNQTSSFVDEKAFKNPKYKEALKSFEIILSDLYGSSTRSGVQVNAELTKNFRETVNCFKQRDEKMNLVEGKLKQSEQERKKLQGTIDQIWKDYESLDASFSQLKKASDVQMSELKPRVDREQELESKILETMMGFQKEKLSTKILLAAEQPKKEAARQLIEGLQEQNKVLLEQIQDQTKILEEYKELTAQLKEELEQSNLQTAELQQTQQLNTKKFTNLQEQYQELISDHERVKHKLTDAYDVLENIDNKELKNKANSNNYENSTNSAEIEKIKNLTTLLQCQCGERIKDVILQKCLHPFCRQCIDKQIKTRQRTCPKCRAPFGTNDVKTLYLSN